MLFINSLPQKSFGRKGESQGTFPISFGSGFPLFNWKKLKFRSGLNPLDSLKSPGPLDDFTCPTGGSPSERGLSLYHDGRTIFKIHIDVIYKGTFSFGEIKCTNNGGSRNFPIFKRIKCSSNRGPYSVSLLITDRIHIPFHHPTHPGRWPEDIFLFSRRIS